MKLSLLVWAATATVALAAPALNIENTLDPRAPITLDLESGGSRQHIGFHYGDKLYAAIRDCIEKLCPPGIAGDKPCKGDTCSIPKIAYNAKGHLAYNSFLLVKVDNANYPYGKHGQREALIETVASHYKAMSEMPQNCYTVELDGKDQYMCNINEYAKAAVHNAYLGGHLAVSTHFNGKTLEGPLDCYAGLDKSRAYAQKMVHPVLLQMFGVGKIDNNFWCAFQQHGKQHAAEVEDVKDVEVLGEEEFGFVVDIDEALAKWVHNG